MSCNPIDLGDKTPRRRETASRSHRRTGPVTIDTEGLAADTLRLAEQALDQLETARAGDDRRARYRSEVSEDEVGKAIVEAASWRDLRGLWFWRPRSGYQGPITGMFDVHLGHWDRAVRHVRFADGDHDRLDWVIVEHDDGGVHEADHPAPGWRATLDALRRAPALTEEQASAIVRATHRGSTFTAVLPGGDVVDVGTLW